jgi:hypothetical protein
MRQVPDHSQIIGGSGQLANVGRWLLLGEPVTYWRELDGVGVPTDPDAVVLLVVPNVADAILNMINGGFTITAMWEE